MADFTTPDANGVSVPVATPDYEAGQVLKANFQALSSAVTAEASARSSGDSTNATAITAETARAQAAEALLQTLANLSQSITTDFGSTTKYPSVKAVYDFAAIVVAGLMKLKGNLDCSGNPNYPAASVGDTYYVTVPGKIGGASGISVEIGDAIVCKADNAGGTQAAVGASWFILEHNLQGALLAANNLSDVANPATALANLGGAAITYVDAQVALKLAKASNLSDVASPVTACSNLGVNLRYGGALSSAQAMVVGHHYVYASTSALASPPTFPTPTAGQLPIRVTDLSLNSGSVNKTLSGGAAQIKDGVTTPDTTFTFNENSSRAVSFIADGTAWIAARG